MYMGVDVVQELVFLERVETALCISHRCVWVWVWVCIYVCVYMCIYMCMCEGVETTVLPRDNHISLGPENGFF